MRHLTSGSLLILDAQDAAALGRVIDTAYPREVLETMTADELRRARALLHAGRYRLGLVEARLELLHPRAVEAELELEAAER